MNVPGYLRSINACIDVFNMLGISIAHKQDFSNIIHCVGFFLRVGEGEGVWVSLATTIMISSLLKDSSGGFKRTVYRHSLKEVQSDLFLFENGKHLSIESFITFC